MVNVAIYIAYKDPVGNEQPSGFLYSEVLGSSPCMAMSQMDGSIWCLQPERYSSSGVFTQHYTDVTKLACEGMDPQSGRRNTPVDVPLINSAHPFNMTKLITNIYIHHIYLYIYI